MNPSLSVVSLPWMLGLQEGGYSCRIMLRDISKTFFALFIIYLYIATGCHLRRTSQWYHDLIWKGSSFQGYHRKLTYSQSYGTENDLHRVTAFPGFQSNLSSSVLSVGLQCRMCFMFVLVSFEFPGIPIFATREISYLSFLDSHLSYPWEYHGGGRNHARNNEKLQTKKKKKLGKEALLVSSPPRRPPSHALSARYFSDHVICRRSTSSHLPSTKWETVRGVLLVSFVAVSWQRPRWRNRSSADIEQGRSQKCIRAVVMQGLFAAGDGISPVIDTYKRNKYMATVITSWKTSHGYGQI